MDLVALQGTLDNASFAVLFITMLLYWSSAAFLLLFMILGQNGDLLQACPLFLQHG